MIDEAGITKCRLCQGERHRHIFTHKGYDLVRCLGCNLVFVRNPPETSNLSDLYNGALDDGYHEDAREEGSVAANRLADVARQHLGFVQTVIRSGQILDIGCATGDFVAAARAAGFDASGMDVSEKSVRYAQDVRGFPVSQGRVQDCRVPDGTLDAVTAFDVVEHVPDPMEDLRCYHRLLKPGGWLFLSTPNVDGLFPRLSLGLAKRLNYWPHAEPPHHLFQFSEATLRRMLTVSGFDPSPVQHRCIDLSYSFGHWSTLCKMPKRLAYASLFAPFALVGPWMGLGDWIYMAAQRRG
jgi:2-polyprenyl-3-methyl-5-hydroxy-6-metoxy-1,4-benzoquinol methylase